MSLIAPPRRRAPNPRTIWVIVGSIVAVGVIAVVLANTADSGNKKPSAKGKNNNPATTVPAEQRLRLAIGKVVVQNTGPAAKVPGATRKTLLGSTQLYVDGAIIAPLEQGQANATYTKIFDAGVRKAASRNDVAVLTETQTGKASGAVHATASPVRIDAIGDPTGKLALAATSWTMNIQSPTPKGRVTIRRKTELTFANEFGKWYVTAYRVTVRRTIGAKTASQTITSGGAPSGVSS